VPRVAVALGSNLGDRRAHLESSVARLKFVLSELRVSRIHETEPVAVVGPQDRFLNAAATGGFEGSARDLMAELLRIEREHGRERPYPGAPRTLDLDLILFGAESVEELGLVIPHPRFRERRFVLEPLAEIAADWQDPVTGLTVKELLERLQAFPPGR
jgi:2-amino-4-hydroxy-6-hydroxymethyldihydropteridine diphosphokinase